MSEMTSRERVLSAMRGRPVDYAPCSPFLNPQDRIQRFGKTYNFPFGPSSRESVQYGVEVLGLDMHVPVPWRSYYPSDEVAAKSWFEDGLVHKEWRTPAGTLHCSVLYDHGWPHGLDIPLFTDYTIGRFVDPWLTCAGDLACLEHILLPPRTQEQIEELSFGWMEASSLAERYSLPTMVSIGSGLTGAHQLCDSEKLCLLVVDQPELIEGYLALEHGATMKNCEIILDFGVDIVRRNGFYESCDFFSPDLLSRYLDVYLKKEAAIVKHAGAASGYTILTGYTPMTQRLSDLGFDSIMVPDPFFEGEDAAALSADGGGRCSYWSGPSDTLHMPWDDQDGVREAVRKTFTIFGSTGLILSPCSSAKAPHPWENVLAMVDEWKKIR